MQMRTTSGLATATRTTTTRTTPTPCAASGDGSPPLCAVHHNESLSIDEHGFGVEDLFDAYFDCRRNKRNTMSAIHFEMDLEGNLLKLYRQIKEYRYRVGRSVCFVVTHPKPREIWAGGFRDRVVHHLVYNAIAHRIHKRFISDTYSCIPGRGTHAAMRRLSSFGRSITQNYTRRAYYLKADVANFFVSIDKTILYKLILKHVDEPWVRDILRQIVFHDPRTNCWRKSPSSLFARIPPHKSLWNAPAHKGLPIGNLTSQFFSNIYLNELDQFVKHQLRCRYYLRYVDDFVILHKDPAQLNEWYSQIDSFLGEQLALRLHPNKIQINLVEKGIDFVGFVIKPGRSYLRQTTIGRAKQVLWQWGCEPDGFSSEKLNTLRDRMNSYLGMLQQVDGYRMRRHLCGKAENLFLRADTDYRKLVLP